MGAMGPIEDHNDDPLQVLNTLQTGVLLTFMVALPHW